LATARHVAFFAMDDKHRTAAEGEEGHGRFYETIPIELARQQQTILAYELDGKPLPVEHGAPLRLRVESQLGFKMVKWIQRIELIDDYARLGKGQGGWREDNMFYSPAVAI
jgi:DMSO/TMAO reductase YedYZ molybdopterin-dependent catalytic subunit